MNRRQKIIATALWVVFLTTTLVLLAVWSGQRLLPAMARAVTDNESVDQPPLFEVPAFALTDQENRTVTCDSLKGHPWITAFIFTRCPGPCPLITARMAGLQEKLPANVKLVSFSLDPAHDTPDVLKAYGQRFGADDARWHFLTGDRAVIDGIANELKIAAKRGSNPVDINHGTHLVLVNAEGKVHGYYRHGDDEATQQLIADARRLAKKK